jgi:hypothetical protein
LHHVTASIAECGKKYRQRKQKDGVCTKNVCSMCGNTMLLDEYAIFNEAAMRSPAIGVLMRAASTHCGELAFLPSPSAY